MDPSTSQKLFYIIGPLRTGSSLTSRCIDDHPEAICLCESEINRALFSTYDLKLHWERMLAHGLTHRDIVTLYNGKRQNDIDSFLKWHKQSENLLKKIYKKPEVKVFGDKSPDIWRSNALTWWMSQKIPLIYTVRDPRAILRSIEKDANQPMYIREKHWQGLIGNFNTWEVYLNQPNILISRYEDLVREPEVAMKRIYHHLGLDYSARFQESFARLFPKRFLWNTVIDNDTGKSRDFDLNRTIISDNELTKRQLDLVYSDPTILRFMRRFGYLN